MEGRGVQLTISQSLLDQTHLHRLLRRLPGFPRICPVVQQDVPRQNLRTREEVSLLSQVWWTDVTEPWGQSYKFFKI